MQNLCISGKIIAFKEMKCKEGRFAMKKTLSIFLAVVLLLSVVGSTVSAETTAVSSTLSYEKAPDALIDMFEEAGCDVPISAEFSLVPAVSTTGRNVSSIEDNGSLYDDGEWINRK